jgi:hypothetical protein
MDLKGTIKGSFAPIDDAAVLSRCMPANWRTWNVPEMTSQSMTYGGAAAEIRSEIDDTSRQAYEQLLDALETSSGRESIPDLSTMNSWIASILTALTFNPWLCAQNEIVRAHRMNKLMRVINLIIAILLRWYNSRCWVLPIVILSLWALKSKVPTPFWHTLSKWKILYHKQTTEMIATDLGLRAENFPAWASRRLCIVAFDNCLINFATAYEGIRALGEGSRPYLFINWFLRPINVAEIPVALDTLAPEGLFYNLRFEYRFLKSFKHFFKHDAEIRYLEHHHHSGCGRRMDSRQ